MNIMMNKKVITTLQITLVTAVFLCAWNWACGVGWADEEKLPTVFQENELNAQQQQNLREDYVTRNVFVVDLANETKVLARDLSAEEDVSNAMVLMRNNRIGEAVTALEHALKSDPENKTARHMLADIYNENGAPEKSIPLYSRLIEENPKDFSLLNSRGYAYGRMGLNDKALEDYNQALSINPDDPNAISNRAALYTRSGQMDLAQKDYEHLVAFDQVQGNYGLGNMAASKEDWPAAQGYYEKTMAADPNFSSAYLMRGQVYLQLGQDDKAVQDFKRAKELGLELPEDLEKMVSGP